MKTATDTRRANALRRMERTRMQLLLRCAGSPDETTPSPPGPSDVQGFGHSLNTVLGEWLACEIAARLWPEPGAQLDTDPRQGTLFQGSSNPPSPPLPQPLLDWATRHPWLSVLAGLLAGGLAMSQRRQLLRWGVAKGLPWLTSQAAVIAVPLLAQWLARQPAPVNEARSPAAGSPE